MTTDTDGDATALQQSDSLYRGVVCGGCGKHITGRDARRGGRCHDCGGPFRPACPSRLACDRCGEQEASSILGEASEEYSRLCSDCIGFVNEHPREQWPTEQR